MIQLRMLSEFPDVVVAGIPEPADGASLGPTVCVPREDVSRVPEDEETVVSISVSSSSMVTENGRPESASRIGGVGCDEGPSSPLDWKRFPFSVAGVTERIPTIITGISPAPPDDEVRPKRNILKKFIGSTDGSPLEEDPPPSSFPPFRSAAAKRPDCRLRRNESNDPSVSCEGCGGVAGVLCSVRVEGESGSAVSATSWASCIARSSWPTSDAAVADAAADKSRDIIAAWSSPGLIRAISTSEEAG